VQTSVQGRGVQFVASKSSHSARAGEPPIMGVGSWPGLLHARPGIDLVACYSRAAAYAASTLLAQTLHTV